EVQATFSNGSLRGTVEDCAVRIGAAAHKLSEIQAVYGGTKPGAMLKSGKRLEGKIEGLESVAVSLGSEKLTINLSSAEEVGVRDTNSDTVVVLDLVATLDGQQIGKVSHIV